MREICFSIKIPCWKIIHFDAGKKVGESRPACFKGLAHYDRYSKSTGKSVRNFVGELNHYDCRGRCTGYSRQSGLGEIMHFDARGEIEGKTHIFFGILLIHSKSIGK